MSIFRIIVLALLIFAAFWQIRLGMGDWPNQWLTAGKLKVFDRGRLDAMDWLRQNTPPDSTVMAEQFDGNWIIAFARRRVVSSSKVYPSEAAEVARRYRDISQFFFATSGDTAKEIIDRYGVDYVYISTRFPLTHCRHSSSCRFVLNDRLTPEGHDQTVIGGLLRGSPSILFELVWAGGGHRIYRAQ